MNERIKELERQCWQSTQTEPYALFDVKKFAELIVRGCSLMCLEDKDSQRILKHFGVEE